MKKSVSIVIPVFNGKQFIRQCLQSILTQNYPDIEAIIVDDGSSDGLDAIADELLRIDTRIKYFHISNSGVTAARRRGIEEASGNWICFLDVDDTLPSDAMEKYSAHFEDAPDIIASGEPKLSLEQYKCGLMRRKSHPELWGKLFRADFIKKHYPALDRSFIIGEDQTINLVLANNASKLVTIPELLYLYNLGNPESVTKRFHRTEEYEIKFEKLFDSLVKPGFEPYSDALQYAEYKMKIEGFKMVVLDGNRFDCRCPQWRNIVDYYSQHPEQPAASEKLLIRLERRQKTYAVIMRTILAIKK